MNNENRVSKKELAERTKEDERVTKVNDDAYKDKNIEKVETTREKFKDAKGHTKEKVIEHVAYRNKVVKSRLTSVYKDGRLIYSVAPKTKKKKRSA